MKSIHSLVICCVVIMCVAVFPAAGYGAVINTDQVINAAQEPAARDILRDLARRSDVTRGLDRIGISQDAALTRVNAMTDADVARIAGRIDSLPVGGASVWALIVGFLIIELIIYFWIN